MSPPPPPPPHSPSPPPPRRTRNYLRDLLTVRLINAFWLATFFQPDEYFQALEPAWQLAFGPRSGAWLTWEWRHQLRSSLHPALFAAAYSLAHGLSRLLPAGSALRTAVIVAAPRALQALIAALGDWFTWRLAVLVYGPDTTASFFALFLQVFSPWQWYCSTRTFSNSIEATLTVMALYYFPWPLLASAPVTKENPRPANVLGNLWRLRASLSLAALAVVLRPTNLLIWAAVGGVAMTRVGLRGPSPLTAGAVLALLREAVVCGSLVLAVSLVSDRVYFGFWTFPPYNWLNFNLSESLAVFYGRNPWHYYLLQGLPLLCTTSLPFALAAFYKPLAADESRANILRTFLSAICVTIGALSIISHKEVRFIYPLLPILNVLSAPLAASFFTSPPSSSSPKAKPRLRRKPYLLAALGVNMLLAGYLSFLHQPAPLTILSYLRAQYERIHPASVQLAHATSQPPAQPDELFAVFLMPCHSTPWRSHLVYPGLRAYALSCEPPLHTRPNTPERERYRDEADRFYDAPVDFLRTELFVPGNMEIPRYIVGFQGIEPWLNDFLQTPEGKALGVSLSRTWSGFNGFFNEDWRRAGQMMVWDTGIYKDAPPGKTRATQKTTP